MNQPTQTDNFYTPAYTLEEIADLVNLAIDDNLEDELTAVRIATRRTLEKIEADLSPAEFAKLTALTFRGATTVASLLRTRRAISGQAADGILNALAQIIQELANERGWIL